MLVNVLVEFLEIREQPVEFRERGIVGGGCVRRGCRHDALRSVGCTAFDHIAFGLSAMVPQDTVPCRDASPSRWDGFTIKRRLRRTVGIATAAGGDPRGMRCPDAVYADVP